ncbi:hypothetical protein E4U42_001359 [Claviceps africana]|uniref:Glycosyl transferase n=1 Tax=Claviceps africana TaxID=83212 RepID=A0A8K0JD29_9HYPO|nr:hypothetical protein E4U42_001359 [Claviceps africana]
MSGSAHLTHKQQLSFGTSPSPRRPKPIRSRNGLRILLMALFLATWLGLRRYSYPWTLHPLLQAALPHAADEPDIPNRVHLVRLLDNPGSAQEFSFHFTDFLSVYAAWHHWRPHALYLHTNAVEATIAGGRDGLSGRWTKYILQVPNLTVLRVPTPTTADNGVEISSSEHRTEFVAVQAVRDTGGVYMGFDTFALRDIRAFRNAKSPFVAHALPGNEGLASVSHDFFMSSRGGSVVSRWADMLHRTYSPFLASPSDIIVTELTVASMARFSTSTAVMSAPAFESDKRIVGTSAPVRLPRGGSRQRHGQDDNDGGGAETDWSRTFVLQISDPQGIKWTGTSFESVTPRYLLESQSEFARVMDPVTRALLEKGLIRRDDDDP